jgi:citrate synthase
LARTAGLIGHIAEEMRRPVGPDIYRDVDRATDYQPPRQAGPAAG